MYLSTRSPPCGWDFICHTQIVDRHTGPTQHVRVLISAELDHATLYAQGWVGGKISLDSMLSSCLLRCAKLCSQWSLSICMQRIANLHRIIPDCICSYGGSMVENLRMQLHFEIRSNLIPDSDSSCLESWRIRLYRILHLSELCGALTPEAPAGIYAYPRNLLSKSGSGWCMEL